MINVTNNDETPTDENRTGSQSPDDIGYHDQDHVCDGYIDYHADELLLKLGDEWRDVVEVDGTCEICGRELTIDLAIDVEMLKTTDAETGIVLHWY